MYVSNCIFVILYKNILKDLICIVVQILQTLTNKVYYFLTNKFIIYFVHIVIKSKYCFKQPKNFEDLFLVGNNEIYAWLVN